MKLIGIAGKARTGKDTAALRLVTEHYFTSYKFALPLKSALAVMFGLTYAQLEGDEKEETITWLGKSPRELMQTLGTEWGRDLVADNVWLRVAQRQLALVKETTQFKGMVISDVRFENEAVWVRNNGGTVVHLLRGDREQVAEHSSESGVLFYPNDDILINNDKTITDLYTQIDFAVS